MTHSSYIKEEEWREYFVPVQTPLLWRKAVREFLVFLVLAYYRVVGLDGLYRSLPTKTFYDSKENNADIILFWQQGNLELKKV